METLYVYASVYVDKFKWKIIFIKVFYVYNGCSKQRFKIFCKTLRIEIYLLKFTHSTMIISLGLIFTYNKH